MVPEVWLESDGVGGGCEVLGARHGIPALAARILTQAGMAESDLPTYLKAEALPLPDPMRLPDMAPAVERVSGAARLGEKVLVHGDYDVDGLMGATILSAGLRALGAKVTHFIPSRFDGGYGLSESSLAAARDFGATLVVTADCGTNPGSILDGFRGAGISMVVTDHHIPQPEGPRAEVFVNAHSVAGHCDADLCGASVAMQLVRAVAASMGRDLRVEPFLRLAAMATVADVVPVTLTNRSICRAGLSSMSESPSPALAQLCRAAGVIPPVRSCHVGYGLAPRFNAAGRMERASVVVDMLLERDRGAAARHVSELERMNSLRKAQQAEAYELAQAQVADCTGDRALVACLGEGRFRGVAGPVAARLAERFGRSAFVMALEGDEYTGSARAANGDDVTRLLARCAPLLVRFGGHGSAAGFTLLGEKLEAFRQCLQGAPEAEHEVKPQLFHRLEPRDTEDIWRTWGVLDPFGPGNAEPYLGISGLVPKKVRSIKDRHLAWDVDLHDGKRLTCIQWGALEEGLTTASVRPGKIFVGKPVPESRPGPLPYFFQVKTILG